MASPREARRAHVHPIGPRSETLARDDPGLGLDFDDADREFTAKPNAAQALLSGVFRLRADVNRRRRLGQRGLLEDEGALVLDRPGHQDMAVRPRAIR